MTTSQSPEPTAVSSPKSVSPDEQTNGAEASSSTPATESSNSTPEVDGSDKADNDADKSTTPLDSTSPPPQQSQAQSPGNWQAIWSPAHNAYYFYNALNQETTWTNPLQAAATPAPASPPAEPSPDTPVASTSTSSMYDLQAAAAAQGIDPALAYLDPSLAAGPSSSGEGAFTAKFNARTGAFTRPDGRDPTHLSEYERAKRMSEFYFDVNEWEKDVEARKVQEETEGKKRKRPTRKDLDRFKEQKKLKKIAKTAWLRT